MIVDEGTWAVKVSFCTVVRPDCPVDIGTSGFMVALFNSVKARRLWQTFKSHDQWRFTDMYHLSWLALGQVNTG
jgi:hypothetical protein